MIRYILLIKANKYEINDVICLCYLSVFEKMYCLWGVFVFFS